EIVRGRPQARHASRFGFAALCLSGREGSAGIEKRYLSINPIRIGLPAVVLPLEFDARRIAVRGSPHRRSAQAEENRSSSSPHAQGSEGEGVDREFRRPMVEPAPASKLEPRPEAVPQLG